MIEARALWELKDAIARGVKASTSGYPATYSHKDADGTHWVTIRGSEEPVPATGFVTSETGEGDSIRVSLDGGSVSIIGNDTNPSVGATNVLRMARIPAAEVQQRLAATIAKGKEIADQAKRIAEAVGQHVWTADDGLHLTEVTEDEFTDTPQGRNMLLNVYGFLLREAETWMASFTEGATAFYDGLGNAASNIVAQFGADGARIGRLGESHAEIDSNSLQFVDESGEPFFLVNDAVEVSEAASLVEIFESTGSSTVNTLTLQHAPARTPVIYRTDGMPSTITSVSGNVLTLEFALRPGSIAIVPYETTDYHATNGKTMMLGVNEEVPLAAGAYSASVGTENQPSGDKSMTVGSACRTVDSETFASGGACLAAGEASVAHGAFARAVGFASFAQGGYVVAYGPYQHAIGRFNEVDINSNYPFVIGNGTADNARSNALTVDWDGRLWLAGNITATAIELSTTTPYIDFHFDNSTADYTSRIIENTSGHLNLIASNGVSFNGGALDRSSGGTGQTGISTSSVTLSGCTASGQRCWHNGVTCSITMLDVKLNAALANGGSVAFGTIPSGYRPSQTIYDVASSSNATFCGRLVFNIYANGQLGIVNRSGSSLPANTPFSLFVTYAI